MRSPRRDYLRDSASAHSALSETLVPTVVFDSETCPEHDRNEPRRARLTLQTGPGPLLADPTDDPGVNHPGLFLS